MSRSVQYSVTSLVSHNSHFEVLLSNHCAYIAVFNNSTSYKSVKLSQFTIEFIFFKIKILSNHNVINFKISYHKDLSYENTLYQLFQK